MRYIKSTIFLLLFAMQLYAGFFKTLGFDIVDPDGNKFILKGYGLGGWLVPEGYMLHTPGFGSPSSIRNQIVDVIGEEETKKFFELYRKNYVTEKDIELIENYIERRGWDMEVTESGLFYQIYEHGNGKKALNGKNVTINYVVSLLDGTICYDSENLGPKEFVIGKSNEESGLEQGVLMMRAGDKARFIMPPHLAHGLLGDENRIPARAIIVYEVELLDVSD